MRFPYRLEMTIKLNSNLVIKGENAHLVGLDNVNDNSVILRAENSLELDKEHCRSL